MQERTANFRFIDLPTSAERLGLTRNQLLQLVEEGRIKPFTGSGQQSVFRATDVDRLSKELHPVVQASEQASEESQPASTNGTPTQGGSETSVRRRRRDAIKLMGTRLSTDSRWAEMTDQDIATWLDALEPVQFERVRKVCRIAIERLEYVLARLDEHEAKVNASRDRR